MATSERRKRRPDSSDESFRSLHESREVCAYEAIERLVQAGEKAGLSVEALIQMLDGGVTLEELLDLIEARITTRVAAAQTPHRPVEGAYEFTQLVKLEC